jgi:hypothetical protein
MRTIEPGGGYKRGQNESMSRSLCALHGAVDV